MQEKSTKLLEARGGIEPPNKGFADLCLTTWLPRRSPSRILHRYPVGFSKVKFVATARIAGIGRTRRVKRLLLLSRSRCRVRSGPAPPRTAAIFLPIPLITIHRLPLLGCQNLA
jgi:hypothetical protein